jgi:hypothetical protein
LVEVQDCAPGEAQAMDVRSADGSYKESYDPSFVRLNHIITKISATILLDPWMTVSLIGKLLAQQKLISLTSLILGAFL